MDDGQTRIDRGATWDAADHTLAPPKRSPLRWLLAALVLVLFGVGITWWLTRSAEVGRLGVSAEGVYTLSLSADGGLLLTGSGDRLLRLWDVDGRRELLRLDGHEGRVLRVALAADGKSALSTGGSYEKRGGQLVPVDAALRFWDLAGALPPKVLAEPGVPLNGALFAPDGKHALAYGGGYETRDGDYVKKDGKTATRDCGLWLYDLATGREVRRFGHKEPVLAAAYLPDGRRFVAASSDGMLRVWDATTGSDLRTLDTGDKSAILCLATSSDGSRLLTGDAAARLRLWDLDAGDLLYEIRAAHGGPVRGVAFAPDGTRALSGGDDYALRLWDVATGTRLRHYTGHGSYVTAVTFLPDGRRAASASSDGTVRLWRLPP